MNIKITIETDTKTTVVRVTKTESGGCVVANSEEGEIVCYTSIYEAGGEILTDALR